MDNQVNTRFTAEKEAAPQNDKRRHTRERLERMFQAARLYYEVRKLSEGICPICKEPVSLTESIAVACSHCKKVWTTEQKVRLNQADVADLLSSPTYRISRSEVQRLLVEAEEQGVVSIGVTRATAETDLFKLGEDVRHKYENLKKVVLVTGRTEMLSAGALDNYARDAIRLATAKRAAEELEALLDARAGLKEKDTLCLAWGNTCHQIVTQLRPTKAIPDLTVVPLVGAVSNQPFGYLYDANLLVQEAARAFGCEKNAFWLPAPAFVENAEDKRAIERSPLVSDVLWRIRKSTVVVTSLASANSDRSALVRHGLLTKEFVDNMVHTHHAKGELSGHYFDDNGAPVEEIHPIGLETTDMIRMVAEGLTVMGVVSGYRNRISPLRAAIRGKIINFLVTDSVTAQELLRDE